ncbi:hypothetical protein ASG45_13600 [Microbacterium sp. Leaf436]|nr:hypothetical protein ASG45_13600 [Microbacterium sp. Leaf436]
MTERDIPIVYFLGHFVGADVEACSLLNTAKTTSFGNTQIGGGLTSISTTQNRLDKLRTLAVVDRYRHPVSGTYSYGLTAAGFAAAREYGLDMEHGRSLNGIAVSRLPHYRAIALVAAKFASPAGYFRKAGIEPVPLEKLVSENRMRAAYEPVREEMKQRKTEGKTHSFGEWRDTTLTKALDEVRAGTLPASELIDAYPSLLTLGVKQGDGVRAKPVHQPDLVVNLDAARQSQGDKIGWANSVLVEVERSIKDRAEYTRILATFAYELKQPNVVRRVFYFTTSSQVEKILRDIDAAEGFGLFEKGKLTIIRLTGRDNQPVANKRRVITGGN